MFNNPHFTNQVGKNFTGENENIRQGVQNQKSRPSVQDIMNKYEVRNSQGQGQRFTFQTEKAKVVSPERQTFGNNPYTVQNSVIVTNKTNESERQSFGENQLPQSQTQIAYRLQMAQKNNEQPGMILKSINESNLSQVYINSTIIFKVLSDFSIISESPQQTQEDNIIFQNPFNNQQFIIEDQKKQTKVQERFTFGDEFKNNFQVSDFKNYQISPGWQIPQNSEIMDQTRSYVGEDELFDDMSVLRDKVLDLLHTYSNDLKSNQDPKMVKSRVQQDASLLAKKYSQIIDRVNVTDISALTNLSLDQSQFPNPKKEQELNMMFNLVDDFLKKFESNKQEKSINYSRLLESKFKPTQPPQPLQQIQQNDISVLPSFPLAEDSFYQKEQISNDKLFTKLAKLKLQLEIQLESSNLPYTKTILIDMIQNLNSILQANDIQTVKTVVYKIEQSIKLLNQKDQGSLQLFNYMAKAIKATQKRINIIEDYREPQIQNQQQKRLFFDIALKSKAKLPNNHKNKLVLVSVIYEEFLAQGIKDNMMEYFINERIII